MPLPTAMDPAVQARVDANPDAMRMQRDAAVARPPPGAGASGGFDPEMERQRAEQARSGARTSPGGDPAAMAAWDAQKRADRGMGPVGSAPGGGSIGGMARDPAALQAKQAQALASSRAAGAPPPGAGGYGTAMPQLGRPPQMPAGPRMPPVAGAKPMAPGGAFGMKPQGSAAGPWGQQSKSAMMTGRAPPFAGGMQRGGNR